MGRPALSDSAKAEAFSAITPTISVGESPRRSRTVMDPAYARAHAHRHIDHVEISLVREQLERVCGDADDDVAMKRRNVVIAAFVLELYRNRAAFIEILARRHELAAEGRHCGILLAGVTFWDHDQRRNAMARGGNGHGLAVIAACRGDEALRHAPRAVQGIHVG